MPGNCFLFDECVEMQRMLLLQDRPEIPSLIPHHTLVQTTNTRVAIPNHSCYNLVTDRSTTTEAVINIEIKTTHIQVIVEFSHQEVHDLKMASFAGKSKALLQSFHLEMVSYTTETWVQQE